MEADVGVHANNTGMFFLRLEGIILSTDSNLFYSERGRTYVQVSNSFK